MFDLTDLRFVDKTDFEIKHPVNGTRTGWIWTLAGPGHAQTVAYREKTQAKQLHEERLKEQAIVNGRKWKGDDRDPDEVRRDQIEGIAARVLGFTTARIDGQDLSYSAESCVKLLLDPDFGWLLSQLIDELTEEKAFFRRSAGTPAPSPSTTSG